MPSFAGCSRRARFATELLRFTKAVIMHPVILPPNYDGFP
ncbi:hypothetical protein CGRA01v4_11655 [Colletotrichum graminicola]|nr:hypothetical protein CGRA01v4_11655 [Colletotrichum graminicola]